MAALLLAVLIGIGLPPQEAPAGDPGFSIENPVFVTTFDGSTIVGTLMLPEGASAESPAPTLLKTNGWGTTRPQYPAAFDAEFLGRGYAVFAWDSRGFGESDGRSHWNDPEWEVRDVRAILDYLAERPELQQDGPGDPRVGWIGGSYAGAIQWNTAAVDHRVDAITPRSAGGTLPTDIVPNGVYKYGIFGKTITKPGRFSRRVESVFYHLNSSFELRKKDKRWLKRRSTTTWAPKVDTPTLILAGTVDQAYPLQSAFSNYRTLLRRGTPVKMVAFCGGHGELCPYRGNDMGDPSAPEGSIPLWVTRMIQWLDRYVMEKDIGVGPPLEWQAQDGYYYASDTYPLAKVHRARGRMVYSGPLGGPADKAKGKARIATTLKAYGPASKTRPLVGRPHISLESKVSGGKGYVYLSLVDRAPGGRSRIMDAQTVPVTLKRGHTKMRLKFNALSWMFKKGHSIDLRVTTGVPGFRTPTTDRYEVSLRARLHLPFSSTSPARQKLP